jgi:acetoin utilization deacetylase AcuC-like enzyme
MSALLMVEQRRGGGEAAPWVRERGQVMHGHESSRRLSELRSGLMRHADVRAVVADASDDDVETSLSALHEPGYLAALREVRSDGPVVMPELAAPGLPPDMSVCVGLVGAAHEGVRTAITAARRTVAGARFTYALCRPPGHHAGPGWLAGYCYLNNAAAAVRTLREAGASVGVLDLDLHYPNGTAAIVAPMSDVSLHSLHAWPVTNVAARTVTPTSTRERVVEFKGSPDADTYLDAVRVSLDALAQSCSALVLSLGYDTVKDDPHGSWDFSPAIFARIGSVLADARLPICVIQEGGYALEKLATCSYAFASGLLAGVAA